MLSELFTRHPASVGETYTEHMQVAAGFGLRLFLASLACFVHALLPFLFERTGSTAIQSLHGSMVMSRLRRDDRVRDGVPAC
jgi:Family of unknown function (DUF6356)